MNILEITEVFYPVVGGAGKIVYLSSSGLVKRGHKVSIITRKDKGLKENEFISGIDIYRVNWFNNFFALAVSFFNIVNFVRSFLRKNNPDLIVFNQPFSAFSALCVRDLAKISKIYRYHSSWFEEFKVKNNIQEVKISKPLNILKWIILSPVFFIMKAVESFALKHSDAIIVASQYSKEKLIRFYKMDGNRIHIIPGCVDTDVFKPTENKQDLRKQLNMPQDRFILVTARNLVPRMGIDNLIYAFCSLSKTYKDLYLIIIGEGRLKIKLQKLVGKLSLDNLVKFTGQLKEQDLVKHYQASDLFILPTKYIEHFGLVSIEALASGIPVLGTPVGGTIEILDEFNREFLFEGTDAEAIAKGTGKFLDTFKGVYSKEKCREFAMNRYSLDKIITRTERIFLENIKK
ncbi:MAG: glycosyltransferase family 4 protein [Candidatus Omnitrophica bacterium]|nr:glycosyltransferase family 4 protein [Candidatus Omnitrophota bacterium]